ncbi:ribonucleoside-diphosphate reductase class Ib beta subunit [Oceanobacillus limi]|uniref:Ribonucleoside-diphosphate reductase subunit beta n=1 Tax=Oceanobacillus limi TaxID=930131 RepID=A0A1I0EC13_9BACI|nr:class 1b ribonucleoside-diphosphate reductase subunit beta [Oceanobacillus limi]SET42488.1 ribonucleoside-diphosphate reductase class Ib beta subunit [Oceanobacillus limi]
MHSLTTILTAANWNAKDDEFSEMFALQNLRQFWLPEEVSLSGDLLTWKQLDATEKDTYKKVLAGLTLLDTLQGDVGMARIAEHVPSHQQKAVLTFMGGMENLIHARSYSNIFLTLATSAEIDALFEWVENNPYLQRKATIIKRYYDEISGYNMTLYRAMVASVALESFLFYSGFYYPLYMAGQGKLINSGEIINLIIRDESIHGVYVGLLAQQLDVDKAEAETFVHELFDELLENEIEYTRDVYAGLDVEQDVIEFVKYNANKALNNLGFDAKYEVNEVNPIIINGLDTKSKSHDFFSTKGNSYKKALVEPIQTDDFYFEGSR